MALITCPECKKKISETVDICPHCGYKFTPEKIKEIKATGSQLDKGCLISIIVIVGFAALLFIPLYIFNPDRSSKPKIEIVDPRTEQILKHFNSWDGSHINLTKLIKNSMNDPDSYDHVKTKYKDNGDHLFIVTTYRGKNKFGGVVTEFISAKVDLNGKILAIIDQGSAFE